MRRRFEKSSLVPSGASSGASVIPSISDRCSCNLYTHAPHCVSSRYTWRGEERWLVESFLRVGENNCTTDQQKPGLKAMVQCLLCYSKGALLFVLPMFLYSVCYTMIHRLRGLKRAFSSFLKNASMRYSNVTTARSVGHLSSKTKL